MKLTKEDYQFDIDHLKKVIIVKRSKNWPDKHALVNEWGYGPNLMQMVITWSNGFVLFSYTANIIQKDLRTLHISDLEEMVKFLTKQQESCNVTTKEGV